MPFPISAILILVVLVSLLVGHGTTDIENTIVDHSNIAVISGNYFEAGNAIVNTIEVNFNYYRLLQFDLGR